MKAGIKAGIIGIFALLISLFAIPQAHADEKASAPSATFALLAQAQKEDTRIVVLRKFLQKQDSPLAPYAEVFVAEADLYKLPWDLVPAMTGTESSFGLAVPPHCNNPLGYGIYTNHMTCFASYREAIKTVSKAIRQQYMNDWGVKDPESIGKIYAASTTWGRTTNYFMNQIEEYKLQFDSEALPISL